MKYEECRYCGKRIFIKRGRWNHHVGAFPSAYPASSPLCHTPHPAHLPLRHVPKGTVVTVWKEEPA